MQESFRRTLQLIIDGSFYDSDPELSEVINMLSCQCPTVFRALIGVDNDTYELSSSRNVTQVINTKHYIFIRIWNALPQNHVRNTLHLPIKLNNIPIMHPFIQELQHAYKIDYKMPNVTGMGHRPCQWYHKISFMDRYVIRLYI
jgi:hypothetical protein